MGKISLFCIFTATRFITRRDGCIPTYSTYLVNTNISRSQIKCLSSDFSLTGDIYSLGRTWILHAPDRVRNFIFVHDHKFKRPPCLMSTMNHQDVTYYKISHYTVLRYISCYVLYVLFIIHKKGQEASLKLIVCIINNFTEKFLRAPISIFWSSRCCM